MYVCTFYSFKGGVGRTMALVNTAVELAKRKKRVLVVDFDLEAPGISTFQGLTCDAEAPGLVDYVTEYIKNNEAPVAKDFITKCESISPDMGEIFFMGPGRQDSEYGKRLHQINWQELYLEHEGFLLFEDLKAQWREQIEPDYVLIDSRTGHTDIGGICTRQLPEAVVVMFLPNRQNLVGLRKIVGDIRAEKIRYKTNAIQLHFAMSNVPYIDDEDDVLADLINEFKSTLSIDEIAAEIHYYNSLELLQQQIFTLHRPKTALAKEYVSLTNAIVEKNAEDRDGAIRFLDHMLRTSQSLRRAKAHLPITEMEERIDDIESHHRKDPEILFRLAAYKTSRGDLINANNLLDRAIEHGCNTPEAFARRVFLRRLDGNKDGALEDAKTILNLAESEYLDLSLAARTLAELAPGSLKLVLDSLAVQNLSADKKVTFASNLNFSTEAVKSAEAILQTVRADSEEELEKYRGTNLLSLCLNHLGRFRDSVALFGGAEKSPDEFERLSGIYNFAVALWGRDKKIPEEYFKRVVELAESNEKKSPSANFNQCIAIAYWATGRQIEAITQLERARELIKDQRSPEFSSWRYLEVGSEEFLSDLDEMEKMFSGAKIEPIIFRHSANGRTLQ